MDSAIVSKWENGVLYPTLGQLHLEGTPTISDEYSEYVWATVESLASLQPIIAIFLGLRPRCFASLQSRRTMLLQTSRKRSRGRCFGSPHAKAMPVMLRNQFACREWLNASPDQ